MPKLFIFMHQGGGMVLKKKNFSTTRLIKILPVEME